MTKKKQELFQGANKKNYFEGWYFKNVNAELKSVSFIVGISTVKDDEHAFIQVLDNVEDKSYYARFLIEDFHWCDNPFSIQIENNYFSLEKIKMKITDPIEIEADLTFDHLTPIDVSKFSPNIMGPFAYIPFMQCNHGIMSLRHQINGIIKLNKKKIKYKNGKGYIEKDYGTSFPKKYLWIESNHSNNQKDSFFLACAHIPFLALSFQGLICILEIDGKQERFATYNNSRAKIKKIDDTHYCIVIKKQQKN